MMMTNQKGEQHKRYFAENPELLDDPSSDPHEILREHFASMLAASIIEKARAKAREAYIEQSDVI